MHQQRILSRGESLLRLPASGNANLATAPGQWFELAPRFADERFEISGLALVIAGDGLLAHLQDFCGAAGTLEIAGDLFDGYGTLRNLLGQVPLMIASAQDWKTGTHQGTRVDVEAGTLADGSARAALRGEAEIFAFAAPAQAVWESAEIPLRYASSVTGLSWDAALLRDAAANTVAPPTFELRTGAAGALAGVAYTAVAATVAQAEASFANLGAAAAGQVMQLRITLPYAASDAAAPPRDTLMRTASLFSLCAWLALDRPRWTFNSLAELIERSEFGRHEGRASWLAESDALLLRVPLHATLRGVRRERLMARLNVSSTSRLKHLEIQAVTDLRLDPTER